MNRHCRSRIEAAPGFFLLIALLFYLDSSGIVLLSLLACLLHELGHCAALLILGNDIKRITLSAFGASIEPAAPMSALEEFLIAGAGPGVNLILAVLSARVPEGNTFAGVNLALAVFNLLPVWQLDGARILRCVLECLMFETHAAKISGCLDFCFTLIFAGAGFVLSLNYGNLTLLLMCLWLAFRRRGE